MLRGIGWSGEQTRSACAVRRPAPGHGSAFENLAATPKPNTGRMGFISSFGAKLGEKSLAPRRRWLPPKSIKLPTARTLIKTTSKPLARGFAQRFFFTAHSAVTTDVNPPRAFHLETIVRLRGFSALPRSSQILLVTASKKIP